MEIAPVCFWTNTLVDWVVWSFAWQFQPVVAAGIVTVHPPEVGAVPTLMLKAAVPLLAEIEATVPPQPVARIVGAVLDETRFVSE